MKTKNKIKLLILQHPHEARHPLSTAKMLAEGLSDSIHRVGLSWRSFSHALGQPANAREWAVLYLGTKKSGTKWSKMAFAITDSKDLLVKKNTLKGLVLLDGSWKESKTLWWRNPWLLKLNRVTLNETPVSEYSSLRKEPRKNCLSTIEAASLMFGHLGESETSSHLQEVFESFLTAQTKPSQTLNNTQQQSLQ